MSTRDNMDIYSKKGTKVIYAFPDAGYEYDQKKAASYLVLGQVYTVDYTDVAGWSTDVCLEEFPDVCFNSVIFASADSPERGTFRQ